jgi:hypothetical protein
MMNEDRRVAIGQSLNPLRLSLAFNCGRIRRQQATVEGYVDMDPLYLQRHEERWMEAYTRQANAADRPKT